MPDDFELPPEPQTVEEAKRIIGDIRFGQGCQEESDEYELKKTAIEYQAKVRRHAEKSRKTLAQFTKVIASQLYSSKYRFIYELIQNADDAQYSNTTSLPYMKFRIRPDELVIETNEDGFTVANVYAICSTGESSKKGNTVTTGEKGLGFKSVFGIAQEVHIQSGIWSFGFKHTKKGDGLGMVSPLWIESSKTDFGVGTKITLKYMEAGHEQLNALITKFDELPETTGLFLRRLKILTVSYEGVDHDISIKTYTKRGRFEDKQVSILANIDSQETEHNFRVARRTVRELPEDEMREGEVESDIVLAFPIDSTAGRPNISERGQHIFAFLPMLRIPQIPFLIQADFVAAANRETVPETPWNIALRTAVAKSFAEAVTEFCQERGSLLHHWMSYLPVAHMEGFWEPLYEEIQDFLEDCEVLESRDGHMLECIQDLRIIPPEFLHDDEPLFPDLDENIYLSGKYDSVAIGRLRGIGLSELSLVEMLRRVEADLTKNSLSRTRTIDLGDTWHTSFVIFLETRGAFRDSAVKQRFGNLAILPLHSGQWASFSSITLGHEIYFPHLEEEGVSFLISEEYGLRVLHPTACVVSERRDFYRSLGIGHAPSNPVIDKAIQLNMRYGAKSIGDYVQHFELLFWFGRRLTPTQRSSMYVVNHKNVLMNSKAVYFRSKAEYDAETLLKFTGDDIPGFGYLHQLYETSQVSRFIRHERSWKSWLSSDDTVGIRYYPQLASGTGSSLNPLFEAIIRDNPSKFVGTLKAHWDAYRWKLNIDPTLEAKIGQAKVLCQNGELHPLKLTFLPAKAAKARSRELGIESQMRFLVISEDEDSLDQREWLFLEKFGVCCNTDLSFYLAALAALRAMTTVNSSRFENLMEVYRSLGRIAQFKDKAKVQEFFRTKEVIFLPDSPKSWVGLDSCVWDGPKFLRAKLTLKSNYEKYPEVCNFFVSFLEVGDAHCTDITNELKSLALEKVTNNGSPITNSSMSLVYEALEKLLPPSDGWVTWIRSVFEPSTLIYANGKWENPSNCIWQSTVNIPGRMAIGDIYPNLRELFVEKLKVKTMTTTLILQELVKAARRPQINEIKDLIRTAGRMLGSENNFSKFENSLKDLKTCKFLPVNEKVGFSFESPADKFFIIDHERYGRNFHKKVKILDFAHNDLTSLHPLFRALQIEDRYLSRYVEEETTVGAFQASECLRKDFRMRCFAISCCAVTHRSNHFLNQSDVKHKLLLQCEMFISGELRTKLVIRKWGMEAEADSDRAFLKIDQDQQKLRIYVPSDENEQKSSYRTKLPARLMEILGITSPGAEKQIYRLLTEPVSQLERVMADEDIPCVSWLERVPIPANPNNEYPATPTATPKRQATPSMFTFGANANDVEPPSRPLFTPPENPFAHTPFRPFFTHTNSGSQERSEFVPVRPAQENHYRRILENIVRQARRVASPTGSAADDAFSTASLRDALDEIPISTLNQAVGTEPGQSMTFEANARIGAAGELFVYERLCALGIPGFNLQNWQSRIRHHVKVLPQYRDLEAWSSAEIADIMYEDRTRQMELFLRKHSCNVFDEWQDAPSNGSNSEEKIMYQLEVKTTVGECDTPFFMSKNQYERMQRDALVPGQRPRTVYVVVRVFNLLSKNIGMTIFVDPWQLKDRMLEFVADPWKVTSRTSVFRPENN